MIINPNDTEMVTFLKTWTERLTDRKTKVMNFHESYNKEAQAFKAESEMFNTEFSQRLGVDGNAEILIPELILKAIQKT